MRAIIYIRVSTHEQKEMGFGLQSQRNMCELEARKRGITKKLVFSDALSGSMSMWDRPGLTDALLALKRGNVFIVSHRDRLARDTKVMADIVCIIRNTKATLVIVVEHNKETRNVLLESTLADIITQHEQLIIKSRTKAVLQDLKSQNRCIGNVPFGYKLSDDNKHIEPCKTEQEIIEHAQKLNAIDCDLSHITKEINAKGYASRNGTPFKQIQVKRMLSLPEQNTNMLSTSSDLAGYGGHRAEPSKDLNATVTSLRLNGMSIGAIAREVEAQGFTTKKGTALRNTQISRILQKANLIMPNSRFVPFGFQISPTGSMQDCPQEQALILLVHTLRDQGYSLDDILQHINHHGHTSRAGTPFHTTQIVRMLDKQLA